MGCADKENASSRQDLVRQLLEERRQRLQLKLQALCDDDASGEALGPRASPPESAPRAPLRDRNGAPQPEAESPGDAGASTQAPASPAKLADGDIVDAREDTFLQAWDGIFQRAPLVSRTAEPRYLFQEWEEPLGLQGVSQASASSAARRQPSAPVSASAASGSSSAPAEAGHTAAERPRSAVPAAETGEARRPGGGSRGGRGGGVACAGGAGGSAGRAPRGTSAEGGPRRTAWSRAAATAARPGSAPPRPEPGPEPAPRPQRGLATRQKEWSLRQRALQERRQRAREEKDKEEMQQCTFRPAISSKSEFYARRTRGCSSEPLAERLHHEADKRSALREKAKELMEADEVVSHTFRPTINRSKSTGMSGRAPIHLRTGQIQRVKEERLRAAHREEERRLEAAFQPCISEQSQRLARRRRSALARSLSEGRAAPESLGPVEDRLYLEAQLQAQRRLARKDSLSDVSQSGPSVDEGSRRICRSSVYFQGSQQDFLTRQRTFEAARQRRREIRARHAEEGCPFAPRVLPASRQLLAGNLDFLASSPEETTERLAVRDVGRRGRRRQDLEAAHYRDCTFQPAVDPVSEVLASRGAAEGGAGERSAGGVHERLYLSAVDNRSKSSVGSDAEECTFRPQVSPSNKRFTHVRARYTGSGSEVMENVRSELDRREEQLAERRRELEDREMKECTFTPETGKPLLERPGGAAAPVGGLGRFFELRGLAARQRREQRLREEKILHPSLADARCCGLTIPAPFALSEASTVRGAQFSSEALAA